MESSKVKLEDILSDKQLCYVLNQIVKFPYRFVGSDIRPAAEGLSGFLGDHYKISVYVQEHGEAKQIYLFVKTVPMLNKPKAEFIHENNYFKREALMFDLIEEIGAAKGSNPWCAKAYIHTKHLLVMPDLSVEGYKVRPVHEYLDLHHVLLTVTSVARYHAAIANFLTKKSLNADQLCKLIKGFEHYLEEPTFRDSPWLRAAAKLTTKFLQEFSQKYQLLALNVEKRLVELFIKACGTLAETPNTLNVLIHKDLWVNNILFRYENNVPKNAIIIDYQCTRYGPPAFDLMIFLYLTTSKSFRSTHESAVIEHYFSVFSQCVDDLTKERLTKLNYNVESFRVTCDRARMFGILDAIGIFPYILMDPHVAQKTFDDPDTYVKYLDEDRSGPVLAYARRSLHYKEMQLEVCEEFIERYVLTSNKSDIY